MRRNVARIVLSLFSLYIFWAIYRFYFMDTGEEYASLFLALAFFMSAILAIYPTFIMKEKRKDVGQC